MLALFAVVAAALGAAALVRAGRARPTASARAVAALALSGAFGWLAWRLRPRDGYGVRVDLAGAELARALDGKTERRALAQIQAVERIGRWAPRWVLTLTDGTRRELPRALFSDPVVFADLGRVLSRPEGVSAGLTPEASERPAEGWVQEPNSRERSDTWRVATGL